MKALWAALAAIGVACCFEEALSGWVITDAPRTSQEEKFNLVREIAVPEEKDRTPPASTQELRIVTWNIDHGAELRAIEKTLRAHAADVYLLQEVDDGTRRTDRRDVAAELSRDLGLHATTGVEFEELGQESDGRPAYTGQVTLSRWAPEHARVMRFKAQSGWWQPREWMPSRVPLLQRRLGSRMALVTEFYWGTSVLAVYNAHLESRSAGSTQRKQLREMRVDAARYRGPVVIGGDLNTKYWPSRFLREMNDDGYASALGQRIERTHRIAMALDWIFARRCGMSDGSVVRDESGSDHFPVSAVMRVTKVGVSK